MHTSSLRFEEILDHCIVALHEQGRTVEDCLTRYPDWRDELEPLLRLALRLRAARTLQAPPEFRQVAALRMRNLIAARPRSAPMTTRPEGRTRTWLPLPGLRGPVLTAALSALLLLLVLFGSWIVYASPLILPGDTLYPVKTALEAARLALSPDEVGDATLHLAFATRRLDEIAALLEQGRPEDVDGAAVGYTAHLESVLALMGEEAQLPTAGRTALADRLATELARQEARFAALLDQAPESVQATLHLALAVERLAQVTVALEGGRPEQTEAAATGYVAQLESALAFLGEESPLPADRQTALAGLLSQDLPRHEAHLAALLDRTPAATRPALEMAYTASILARDWTRRWMGREPGRRFPGATLVPLPTSTATPTPSPVPPSPTATPSPTPITPTPTPSPTITPTKTPTPPATPKPSPTPRTPGPTVLPTRPAVPPTSTPSVPPAIPTPPPSPPPPTLPPTPVGPTPPSAPPSVPTPPEWPTPPSFPTPPAPPTPPPFPTVPSWPTPGWP